MGTDEQSVERVMDFFTMNDSFRNVFDEGEFYGPDYPCNPW